MSLGAVVLRRAMLLTDNKLSGELPSSIGDMQQLE
jgi:hypothetical protein